jgi:hypothetical protein
MLESTSKPAVRKDCFFMGPSSFFFSGAVQADLALSWLLSAAQRRSMPCTLAHSSLQRNALRMN